MRVIYSRVLTTCALAGVLVSATVPSVAKDDGAARCIAPIRYLPLNGADVGYDAHGAPALGTYERVSPDGRFVLRSYSGAKVGTVSLMELPPDDSAPIRVYRTPFSNEAFPVQGT